MGSMMVQQQQLDELDILHTEAAVVRARLVMDAIVRVRAAIECRIRPTHDDAMIVQQFIGQRTAQDRFGR
jgi:hypothetical protein